MEPARGRRSKPAWSSLASVLVLPNTGEKFYLMKFGQRQTSKDAAPQPNLDGVRCRLPRHEEASVQLWDLSSDDSIASTTRSAKAVGSTTDITS